MILGWPNISSYVLKLLVIVNWYKFKIVPSCGSENYIYLSHLIDRHLRFKVERCKIHKLTEPTYS